MKKAISSAKYNPNYHFVWCPEYRKPILKNQIAQNLPNILETICRTKTWKILELKIMSDRLHLFISAPPYESHVGIIKILKGVSAKQLFKLRSEIANTLRKGRRWSPSYYVGTEGHVSAENIKPHIPEQETDNSFPHSNEGSPYL